jgi:hypothetical protein
LKILLACKGVICEKKAGLTQKIEPVTKKYIFILFLLATWKLFIIIRLAVLWFFITTVRWSCFRKGGGSDKNKSRPRLVNDEKLSPCLPFLPLWFNPNKKEWESERRSPIIQMALAFLRLAVAC